MKLRTLITLMAVCIITALVAPAFSQEMPAPGTTIDKNNYKKYAHLFPEDLLPIFDTGWGVMQPIKIKVAPQSTVFGVPKAYLAFSAKNKGKYQLDAQGNIANFNRGVGLPFPDLDKSDKDFATKLMWNYDNRYKYDDDVDSGKGGSWEKRKGQPVRFNTSKGDNTMYVNRLAADPKPNLPNGLGLYSSMVFHYLLPDSIKNTIMLSYRYADVKKGDETYMYLPSMRRVLRAEAGQRSTPLLGSTQALDDFFVFDGRTPDFTYTLVKEQKVLTIVNDKSHWNIAREWNPKGELFFLPEGWETRDTYVIDIKPKDPKYPQSRKRIWMDKESLCMYYGVAYDRAGKIWKMWFTPQKVFSLPNGEKWNILNGQFGIDIQFGLAANFAIDQTVNTNRLTYEDATPASLLKRAR
jgi:hypothetical protein